MVRTWSRIYQLAHSKDKSFGEDEKSPLYIRSSYIDTPTRAMRVDNISNEIASNSMQVSSAQRDDVVS